MSANVAAIHNPMSLRPGAGGQIRVFFKDGSSQLCLATLISYADGSGRPERIVIYGEDRREIDEASALGWFNEPKPAGDGKIQVWSLQPENGGSPMIVDDPAVFLDFFKGMDDNGGEGYLVNSERMTPEELAALPEHFEFWLWKRVWKRGGVG